MKQELHIGGVPEHFNLPWQQAVRKDLFASIPADVSWTFFSGGTGAMTKALADEELDIAILLTEGFVSAKCNGLKAKIVKVYIDTPLIWGIYTGANSNAHSVDEKGKYAISRLGSGSHLMPLIHGSQIGKVIHPDDLEIVNSLDGAIASLEKNETQFFYWEKYMTQPFVNQGRIRLIGEFSAPWSGFLIVASDSAMQQKSDLIRKTLDVMIAKCRSFTIDHTSPDELSNHFEMTVKEAETWLKATKWNDNYSIQLKDLINARNELSLVGMCSTDLLPENCVAPWIELV